MKTMKTPAAMKTMKTPLNFPAGRNEKGSGQLERAGSG
jgi:hypothetical protein